MAATQTFNYLCENCGLTQSYDKERKQCSQCRKRRLVNLKPKIIDQFAAPPRKKVTNDSDDGRTVARKEGIRTFTNQWTDDGSLFQKDKEIDKMLAVKPPTDRGRKGFKMTEVSCHECGERWEVNPVFAREINVCDSCKRGRR